MQETAVGTITNSAIAEIRVLGLETSVATQKSIYSENLFYNRSY